MKTEITDQELGSVSGGNYFIWNNDKVTFDTIPGKSWQIKPGKRYEAMAIMDSLGNMYETVAQYDQACLEAIRNAGLLEE